ncbi:MAG: arginine--tRNA ligase [Defluviitaleaceae bacterium]|nr:arginine--tRNA ligase [Defluviitaleaceae bacterium]
MDFYENYESLATTNFKGELAEILATHTNQTPEKALASIETPPDSTMGHFAFPCFMLAKELKKAPPAIAAEIAEKISSNRPTWMGQAVATGPYVNFFLDRAAFADAVLQEVMAMGVAYGSDGDGLGQTVLVEYSSPNIAKHFHIGHLGSTIIGKTLDNIYRFLGYEVTSINHIGDWGTQFGKLITAYLKWGSEEEITKTEIDGLVKLYVKFHEEADNDPSLNDEARAWVVKMQNGDEEGLRIWKWFCDLSMKEYQRIYDRLDVNFDLTRGESYYNGRMEAIAESLEKKGLLIESEGAKIVNLEEYNMPPCLILRSDGGTLYPTRDIAAAIDRYETFEFIKCLYVTGNEQSLHFAQWMKVVELMGYPWASGLEHIPYGMYLFESGKMSTRRGEVIKMEDLLEEAVAKTLAIINEKNPNLANKETVAAQVGVGALKFNKLYNSRIKDTMFDWDRMLNFEGETGPYVQYTHARACSVLKKSLPDDSRMDFGALGLALISGPTFDAYLLTDDEAFDVLRLIHDFPEKIKDAAEKYEPFIIARQLVALAQAYNAFYHEHKVLTDDEPTRRARLALTAAVRQVLKTGLELLGISAPVVM